MAALLASVERAAAEDLSPEEPLAKVGFGFG